MVAEGSAYYVSILPTFTGFAKKLSKTATDSAKAAGKEASAEFSKSFQTKPVEIHTQFNKTQMRKMEAQLRDLTKTKAAVVGINAEANTKQIDAQMAKIREQIARQRGASVGVNIDERQKQGFVKSAASAGKEAGTKMGSAMKSALSFAGIGAALYSGEIVKAAGDFQQQMMLLVTAGGEAQKNLGMMSKGVENIAKSTGTSLDQVAAGAYTVEKAGIRGSKALDTLKAAAQGARGEGADLATMTNALTSIMASYGSKMKDPVKATNELVAAAGASKTTMQEFAAALSTVQPIAARAGVNFAELGGAIGTLTSHGTSAQEATHELSNTIRNLQAPNRVAINEMAQFGINSNDVSKKLGSRGLQGTLEMLSQTILKRMGPSGLALLKTFNQSKVAAGDAEKMYSSLQKLSSKNFSNVGLGSVNIGTTKDPVAEQTSKFLERLKAGQVATQEYNNALRSVDPTFRAQIQQYTTVLNKAKGFNSELRAGGQASQTYTAALKQMLGGATGLNTALQLTGESAGKFTDATKAIAKAGQDTDGKVEAWQKDQKTFNVQMGIFTQTVKVTAVQIATKLLPPLISLVHWIGSNKKTVLGIVTAFVAWRAAIAAYNIVSGVMVARQIAAQAAIEGTAAAQLAATEATKGFTAVQWLLNAALDGNPIVLTVAAIVALGVAMVVAYKKSATFRAIVQGALHGIVAVAKDVASAFVTSWHAVVNFFTKTIPNAFSTALNFIKDHWKLIVTIMSGPLAPLVGVILKFWSPIKGAFVATFNALKSASSATWSVMTRVAKVALTVFKYIGEVIYALLALPFVLAFKAIRAAAQAVWGWIGPYVKAAINALARTIAAVMAVVKRAWSAAWNAVKGAAVAVWNAISGFFRAAWGAFKGFVQREWQGWVNIAHAVWGKIGGPVKAVWNAISGFFRAVWGAFKVFVQREWQGWVNIAHAVWGTLSKPVRDVWNGLKNFLTGAWNGFKKTVSSIWGAIANAIPDAFDKVKGSLSKHMGQIKSAIETPIKWIVNNVLNKFIGLLNEVPGVHLPTISWDSNKPVKQAQRVPIAPGQRQHNAAGGVLPGYTPGRDPHVFTSPTGGTLALSGGEGIIVPEAVRGLGGAHAIHAINAAYSKRAGVQAKNRFAGGGIIQAAWNGIKSGASAAKNFGQTAISKGATWAVDGAEKTAKAVAGAVPGPKLMHNIANGAIDTVGNAVKGAVNKAVGKASGGGSQYKGGGNVGKWISEALKDLGLDSSFSGGIGNIIQHESGGNPNAINLTDSNARAGHPSKGLMQTIQSTFDAYVLPSLKHLGIYNPIANITAGVRYAISRYGAAWLKGGGNQSGGKYTGYASGTPRGGAKRGWAWVGERGRELVHFAGGETVVPHDKSVAMASSGMPGYAKGAVNLKSLLAYLASAFRSPSLSGMSSTDRINTVAGNTRSRTKDALGSILSGDASTIKSSNSTLASEAKKRITIYNSIARARATLNDKKATHAARRSAGVTLKQQEEALQRSLSASNKAQQQLVTAKKQSALATKAQNSLLKAANSFNKKLQSLAKQRDQVASQLANARSYASDMASSARDSALTGAAAQTPGGVIKGLTAKFTSIKSFNTDLKKLSRMGYSKTVLSQVAAAGVTDGDNLAKTLLQAKPGEVKQINGDLNAVDYWSGVLGNTGAAGALGGNADQNYIGNLNRKQKNLQKQIAGEEQKAVNVFDHATIVVKNDAQIQSLARQAARAVSR